MSTGYLVSAAMSEMTTVRARSPAIALFAVLLATLGLPPPVSRAGEQAFRAVAEWESWAVIGEQVPYVGRDGTPTTKGYPAVVTRKADGARMRFVPSGSFEMGAGGTPPETAHTVVLTRCYYMDESEVTMQQWRKFCGDVPEWMREQVWGDLSDDLPAVAMTRAEAVAYAKWAAGDLPTEAEWEWATRRGGRAVPWGDAPAEKHANLLGEEDGFLALAPVGKFPPDAHGFLDTVGNVSEWCLDYYDQFFYMRSPTVDPLNTEPRSKSRPQGVLRGGGYDSGPDAASLSVRIPGGVSVRYGSVGLRCVVRLEPQIPLLERKTPPPPK
jgi:formylglycine-generating enzyme required for sulfatase activity